MFYSAHGAQMIQTARVFATAAHGAINQRRKATNEPYIVHPAGVADIIQSIPSHTWEMVAMAWLHDVCEDTEVPLRTINEIFGQTVYNGVWYLTNCERERGNRKERHRINLARHAAAPADVQTVKLADIMQNIPNINETDPSFARLFLREKAEAVEMLKNGDRVLWVMVRDEITKKQKELDNVQAA